MADLRARCRARAKVLVDSKFDLSSVCINRLEQCDSYENAFVTECLTQTFTRLGPVLAGMRYSFVSKADIEDLISKNNISELCSDASLILRRLDANFSDMESAECAKASMTFLCSWYNRKWPKLGEMLVHDSPEIPGLYAQCCFDKIPVVLGLLPLARQIESCLVAFSKEMNLTWTPLGNDAFKANFDTQATAFFHLAKGIEDAMGEVPDNIRVQRIVTSQDVATDSVEEGLGQLSF